MLTHIFPCLQFSYIYLKVITFGTSYNDILQCHHLKVITFGTSYNDMLQCHHLKVIRFGTSYNDILQCHHPKVIIFGSSYNVIISRSSDLGHPTMTSCKVTIPRSLYLGHPTMSSSQGHQIWTSYYDILQCHHPNVIIFGTSYNVIISRSSDLGHPTMTSCNVTIPRSLYLGHPTMSSSQGHQIWDILQGYHLRHRHGDEWSEQVVHKPSKDHDWRNFFFIRETHLSWIMDSYQDTIYISLIMCKNMVSPFLFHWRYHSLARGHWYSLICYHAS